MGKLKNALIGIGSVVGFSIVTLAATTVINLYDSPLKYVSKDAISDSISVQNQEYLELSDGIYIGETSSNMMNGKGVITFETGDVIEGIFKNNEIIDSSKVIISGVGTYEGEFYKNKRNGKGSFTWENGDVLSCVWKNDSPNGYGTLNYANGDVFEGTFEGDHIKSGSYKTVIGDIEFQYEVEDSQFGTVTITTADNTVCTGNYENGKLNGKCTVHFADGSEYEGQLKDNKRDGEGTYTWPDGSTYSGQWSNDKMNGTGTYYWDYNSKMLKGQWKDNAPLDTMSLSIDSEIYTAEFKDGKCTSIK